VGELGWPWRLFRLVGLLPTFALDRAYDAVARTRYRVFGRYDQCLVPSPEFRDRFVD
jgi:predicted DCC family thiol-disulfide oxidoreductase YuxK